MFCIAIRTSSPVICFFLHSKADSMALVITFFTNRRNTSREASIFNWNAILSVNKIARGPVTARVADASIRSRT